MVGKFHEELNQVPEGQDLGAGEPKSSSARSGTILAGTAFYFIALLTTAIGYAGHKVSKSMFFWKGPFLGGFLMNDTWGLCWTKKDGDDGCMTVFDDQSKSIIRLKPTEYNTWVPIALPVICLVIFLTLLIVLGRHVYQTSQKKGGVLPRWIQGPFGFIWPALIVIFLGATVGVARGTGGGSDDDDKEDSSSKKDSSSRAPSIGAASIAYIIVILISLAAQTMIFMTKTRRSRSVRPSA